MAVKIRLKRDGRKKAPFYHVVVADSRNPRDGKVLETLGFYNPLKDEKEVRIDETLALKWLGNGAIPTDTVRNIFSDLKIMEKFHNSKVNK